ncbi:MAG: hypothetical protein GY927_24010 [bacterium]|nr:hypothetical protein [bacterium]
MIPVTDDIEKLARLVAEKTGITPEEAIKRALEVRAEQVGVATKSEQKLRVPGRLKGKLQCPTGLFDPLPPEEFGSLPTE